LPVREVAVRIATTLMLVYPPGIATIVPGERLDARASPMLDYLLMFEEAEIGFPALAPRSRMSTAKSLPPGA
jgi:ornithine decarboxylase